MAGLLQQFLVNDSTQPFLLWNKEVGNTPNIRSPFGDSYLILTLMILVKNVCCKMACTFTPFFKSLFSYATLEMTDGSRKRLNPVFHKKCGSQPSKKWIIHFANATTNFDLIWSDFKDENKGSFIYLPKSQS